MIPRRLSKEFQIKESTRAIVTATPEVILIKPVTSWAIARVFGLLKPPLGERSFPEEWADHKREELALEERTYSRGFRI